MGALPNLIIAGVNKAGTTSLFSYLSQHPAVFPSGIKETGYFLTYRYAEPARPWEVYQDYFRSWQGQPVVMEATPGYFYGGRDVAEPIRVRLGAVRIVLIFREPAARLVSFYKSQKALLRLPRQMTLAEYVAACDAIPPADRWRREHNTFWGVEGGYYARWLPDWLELFSEHVRIFFFCQFRSRPHRTLVDIASWLDIDTAPFGQAQLGTENRSVDYRNPALQRLALILNRQGERFWRANPSLKQRMRALYYRLNGRQFEEQIDDALLCSLRERYAASNSRVRVLLQELGYEPLPEWLAA